MLDDPPGVLEARQDTMKNKFLSIEAFLKTGLLQEVNRQFFHPRGLALEVELTELYDENGEKIEDEYEYKLGRIWDYISDPEGLMFGGAGPSLEKTIYAQELLDMHADVRKAKYGWVIQPIVEE